MGNFFKRTLSYCTSLGKLSKITNRFAKFLISFSSKDDKIVYNYVYRKYNFFHNPGFPLPILPTKHPSLKLILKTIVKIKIPITSL